MFALTLCLTFVVCNASRRDKEITRDNAQHYSVTSESSERSENMIPNIRARAELNLLRRCAHEHVVNVLGFFSEDTNELECVDQTLDPAAKYTPGSPPPAGLVLEHADGGSLDAYLASVRHGNVAHSGARTQEPQAAIAAFAAMDILAQLFEGVAHCHDKCHVAHRDLKPANCLLFCDTARRSGWRLKLADFGISKHMGPVSGLGTACAAAHTFDIGTGPYQAPELCGVRYFGGKYSASEHSTDAVAVLLSTRPAAGYDPIAADLWALACVSYEVCTLKLAFNGAPDRAFNSNFSRLEQVVLPLLPHPPLFVEEHHIDAISSAMMPVHDVVLSTGLRFEVNVFITRWGHADPNERLSVSELLRSEGWQTLTRQLHSLPAAAQMLPRNCATLHEELISSETSERSNKDPHDKVCSQKNRGGWVGFGGTGFTLLPLTNAANAAASLKCIASMEGRLRRVYCAAEFSTLEMQLLTALIRQRGELEIAAARGGDLGAIEDEINFALAQAVMSRSRQNIAQRLGALSGLFRLGMHRHFAASGWHLIAPQ